MKRSEAMALVVALVSLREDATDAQASKAIQLYPALKQDGAFIPAGRRINWCGQLKRAAVGLWDTAEYNPDNAPELWEDIHYRDGYRMIPENITVGLAFSLGECGWWVDGQLYRSKKDANVHTPAQYPDGWEIVKEE